MRASEWVSLKEYPYYMSQFDIGIVPLDLTPFNQAKSWLKGLEFAALGVPFLASPTEPYVLLNVAYGIGTLAKHRKWLPTLKKVLADHAEIGADHREKVVRHALTIEDQAWQWRDAWLAAHWYRRNT
jgi:hypothetical protein